MQIILIITPLIAIVNYLLKLNFIDKTTENKLGWSVCWWKPVIIFVVYIIVTVLSIKIF